MLIITSNAYADVPEIDGRNWNKWIDCLSNEDCVPIQDACGGWTSANVQYKKEAEEYQKKLAPQIECADVKIEPEPEVVCSQRVCIVKPAGYDNRNK